MSGWIQAAMQQNAISTTALEYAKHFQNSDYKLIHVIFLRPFNSYDLIPITEKKSGFSSSILWKFAKKGYQPSIFHTPLKFRYSEKASKIWPLSHTFLTLLSIVKF